MPQVRRIVCLSICALSIPGVIALHAQQKKAAPQEWRTYGSDKAFTRYSPLDQINAANVQDLKVVWTRPAIDPLIKDKFPDLSPSNYFRGTPVVINGKLLAPDGVGLVEAFDAASGKTAWVQQPVEPTMKEAAGQSTRGAAYWTDGRVERVFVVRGEYLYSLDLTTGDRDRAFGDAGRITLNRHTKDEAAYFGWPGPFVVNDVIVIGGNGGGKASGGYGDGGFDGHAEPENIRGFDVRTGKLLWTFHILPRKGEPGYDTWGKGSAEYAGNMAAWASLTADEQLGYVYIPLSAPTASHYGGHRPGKNLYSDSIVCLNVKSGKMVWYFQTLHHDLWEYDSATPPVLGDITVDGKRIKAVIAANKSGFLYVFDRVNGKPVWPIEERPVPKSTVPGEEAYPTQPFPTKPPAFDRQGFSEDDLIDFTPELHNKALEITSRYLMGPLYTPPVVRDESPDGKLGTLVLPGGWGAGNWNTGAFDPETGWYYAVSMTQAGSFGVIPNPDPANPLKYGLPDGPPGGRGRGAAEDLPPGVPFVVRGALNIEGLPIVKPPYGRVTAYDMNKGEKVWMAANGDGPRNHPLLKDLNLPPLGNTGRPAPMLTKTLLFLADSSDAVMGQAGISGPAKLRAFDKKTGKVVAEIPLPAGATGAPMTYMAEGKQFIVVPVGGRVYGAGWIGLSLP